jgi:hypothetical protein
MPNTLCPRLMMLFAVAALMLPFVAALTLQRSAGTG